MTDVMEGLLIGPGGKLPAMAVVVGALKAAPGLAPQRCSRCRTSPSTSSG
jgi:hypothetical protein